MREKEKIGKTRAFAKSFITGEDSFYSACVGLLYCPSQAKLQNNQNRKLLQGIKWEENQKGEQKLTSETGSRKEHS